jgi:hypothetical protein
MVYIEVMVVVTVCLNFPIDIIEIQSIDSCGLAFYCVRFMHIVHQIILLHHQRRAHGF